MPARETPRKEAPKKSQSGGWLRDYLRQSSRPLPSLTLVLPLLLLYEGGVVLLGAQAVRNGADVWLRQLLDLSGFGQYFLLPALTIGLLVAWHHLTGDRWRVSAAVVYVMFAECAVLGLLLVGAGRVQGAVAQAIAEGHLAAEAPRAATIALADGAPAVGRLVGFMGAGVYEEMLFRLMLLPPIAACVWRLGAGRGPDRGGGRADEPGFLRRALPGTARRNVRRLQLRVSFSGRRVFRDAVRVSRIRNRRRHARTVRRLRQFRLTPCPRCGGEADSEPQPRC